jgi:hypothetical protein
VGTFKAVYQQKHDRWVISDGSNNIGGRKTRGKCEERMHQLMKLSAVPPTSSAAPAAVPVRGSSRARMPASANYGPKKREGNYKAGTGRGHKKVHIDPMITAISQAKQAVMFPNSHSKASVVSHLKVMVGVNEGLKRKLDDTKHQRDALATLLLDKHGVHSALEDQNIKRRRTEILADLGCGYSTEITFKRHRAHALAVLKNLCGNDILQQKQLAQALLSHYTNPRVVSDLINPKNQSNEDNVIEQQELDELQNDAIAAVIYGIKEILSDLRHKKRKGGRNSKKARIAVEASTCSVCSCCSACCCSACC